MAGGAEHGGTRAAAAEPTVSVVVAMRDEAAEILECLRALDAQEQPPDQVILVDNGSSDGSVELVEAHRAAFPRLRLQLLHEPKRGPAAARNAGIAAAAGSVVAFTDADCRPHPAWCREIAAAFARDADLDAVGGIEHGAATDASLVEKLLTASWLPPAERLRHRRVASKTDWLHGVFLSTFNCAFRRDLLQEVGGFDNGCYPAGEDMDLWMRALDAGARIVAWHPDIVVHHRQRMSVAALLHKMYQYGLGMTTVTDRHFRRRLSVQSNRFGSHSVAVPWGTVLLLNQTVVGAPVAAAALVLAMTPAWPVPALAALLAPVWVCARTRALVHRKGYPLTWPEAAAAAPIYVLRIAARYAGLVAGSVRHRLLCL